MASVLALLLGPAVASAQCYEDPHCFYTCGYGYYQRAGKVISRLFSPFRGLWHTHSFGSRGSSPAGVLGASFSLLVW